MNAVVPRGRLAAVLGMLGSEHNGEALNAARLAERIRQQAGVTWSELLERPPSPPATPERPAPDRRPGPHDWRATLTRCRRRPELLTAWEQDFLESIARRVTLTPKQRAVLERIATRMS